MHSIVVLGDTRTHSINPNDGVYSECVIHGGARLMSRAINQDCHAINKRRKSAGQQEVQIYGYEQIVAPEASFWKWQVEGKHLEEQTELRNRLNYLGTSPENFGLPRVSNELRTILRHSINENSTPSNAASFHDRDDDQEQSPINRNWPSATTCPHIVVLDDLGEFWRRLTVNLAEEEALRTLESTFERENTAENAGGQREDFEDVKHKELQAVASLLLRRMSFSRTLSRREKIPVMEPVIIASVKDDVASVFPSDRADTIWWRLFRDEWLRERTIVLLDADDLRDAGLAISTGLSWERSAQDTIAEMHRRVSTRKFLEFGQVVIRYGVTGALHIVKRGPREWSYTLHFNPARSDVAWSAPDRDGVVLGHTSIYASSIVNRLVSNCDEFDSRPLLASLPAVISDAISVAITRCRIHAIHSYGKSPGEARQLLEKLPFPPAEDQELDRRDRENERTRDLEMVSISSVPPIMLRSWSILSQSAQTRIGAVAQDIVRFGASSVLNQPMLHKSMIARHLLRSILFIPESDRLENRNHVEYYASLKAREKPQRLDIYKKARDVVLTNERLVGTRASASVQRLLTVLVPRLTSGDPWNYFDDAFCSVEPGTLAIVSALSDSPPADPHVRQTSIACENDLLAKIESVIDVRSWTEVGDDVIASPLIRFGGPEKLRDKYGKKKHDDAQLVVDRREIEGFRAIQKLMKSHIDHVKKKQNRTPLAIAVFGPPGSGKSTAVRKINESLDDDGTIILPAFNISQFSGVGDLVEAFEKIMAAGHDKVPIAFFDEFDSRFPSEDGPLGWLKYFLSPMEDGAFLGKTVKNAILVFAGGTNNTFEEFSLNGRSQTDEQWISFSKAKGPDFVSRLRGHLNIVGINPVEPDDELYLIRRALLIRSLLSRMQNLADGDPARIDEDMLHAILHVPLYRHGGRALGVLLELCQATSHRISASAVPPIHQLNMLVDGKAFLDLLMNVSAGARVVG